MSLSVFLEVVEIRTKVASVFPFDDDVHQQLYGFQKSQIRNLQIPAQCDRARKHLRSYCSQSDFCDAGRNLTDRSLLDLCYRLAAASDGAGGLFYRGLLYRYRGCL